MAMTFEEERASVMNRLKEIGQELVAAEAQLHGVNRLIQRINNESNALRVKFRQMELQEHEARNKVAPK